MRNKAIVLMKVGELEDRLRRLDGLYRGAGTLEEKVEVYDNIREIVESIRTFVNTEPEFEA